MTKKQLSAVLIAFSFVCSNFSGCGVGSDQPELGEVKGFVTFEGKPLSGASISFIPEDGRPATGVTDQEGKYELMYIRDTPGCKVGRNKVVIRTFAEGEDEIEQEGDDAAPTQSPKATKEVLPPKYNDQTELEAQVEPGKNTFDWELKK